MRHFGLILVVLAGCSGGGSSSMMPVGSDTDMPAGGMAGQPEFPAGGMAGETSIPMGGNAGEVMGGMAGSGGQGGDVPMGGLAGTPMGGMAGEPMGGMGGDVPMGGSDVPQGGSGGAPEPPGLKYLAVSAGASSQSQHHVCALRDDHTIECWGNDASGQATPPAGTYSAVTAGGHHTCALARGTGKPVCWGYADGGRLMAPDRALTAIDAGLDHTCGIAQDNSEVVCWGGNSDGQLTPPDLRAQFRHVDAGDYLTCGVRTDGAVVCWGREAPSFVKGAVTVAVSNQACALDDSIQCLPSNAGTPVGTFDEVSLGRLHRCARAGGAVTCWTRPGVSLAPLQPPAEIFSAVSVGSRYACGLVAGAVVCWGQQAPL